MNRRGFLTGALGFLAAPAIVRASSLMPVKAQPQALFTEHVGVFEGVRYVEITYADPVSSWSGLETVSSDDILSRLYTDEFMQRMRYLSCSLYADDATIGAKAKAAFAS